MEKNYLLIYAVDSNCYILLLLYIRNFNKQALLLGLLDGRTVNSV